MGDYHHSYKRLQDMIKEPPHKKTAEDKRKLRYQLLVYFLTYFSQVFLQFQREFWSKSKDTIAQDPEFKYILNKGSLGLMESTMYFV